MTHCLLAKTEHQQEVDSKNKDHAPSAFPLQLVKPQRRQILRHCSHSLVNLKTKKVVPWSNLNVCGVDWSTAFLSVCGFYILRAECNSSIYWHVERSAWLDRMWKVKTTRFKHRCATPVNKNVEYMSSICIFLFLKHKEITVIYQLGFLDCPSTFFKQFTLDVYKGFWTREKIHGTKRKHAFSHGIAFFNVKSVFPFSFFETTQKIRVNPLYVATYCPIQLQ